MIKVNYLESLNLFALLQIRHTWQFTRCALELVITKKKQSTLTIERWFAIYICILILQCEVNFIHCVEERIVATITMLTCGFIMIVVTLIWSFLPLWEFIYLIFFNDHKSDINELDCGEILFIFLFLGAIFMI